MAEAEPIVFREESVGDQRRVYAVCDWPERTVVSIELISDSPLIAENENGDIIIAVSNGTAVYRRAAEQPNPHHLILDLLNASWSPIPLLQQVAPMPLGRARLREVNSEIEKQRQ